MSYVELASKFIMDEDDYYQDNVSMARRNGIRDFGAWLDSRRPSMRAADTQATTEALIEEITRRAINLAQYSTVDQDNFRRFLRERLGRG